MENWYARAAAQIAIAALPLSAVALDRSRAEVRQFRSTNPCPATGQIRGACHGYQVDHVRPLCAGGEDKPSNMQWIATADHAFKTFIDARECRKLREAAKTPAVLP